MGGVLAKACHDDPQSPREGWDQHLDCSITKVEATPPPLILPTPGGLDGTHFVSFGERGQLSANLELALESDVLGFTLLNNKGKYNARYPTLADRNPNSDHYPAMAFWRASLIWPHKDA